MLEVACSPSRKLCLHFAQQQVWTVTFWLNIPDTDVLFWTPHEYLNYSTFQVFFLLLFFFAHSLVWLFILFVSTDVQCPSLQVDEWKFPQTTRHNITGKKTCLRRLCFSECYFCGCQCMPFADRFQSGEAILPAQECRCQKDPQPSRTHHPPPGQDCTPTSHRVSTEYKTNPAQTRCIQL